MSTFNIQSVNVNITYPISFTLETMTPKFDLHRMNLVGHDLTLFYHVAVQDVAFDFAKIPMTNYVTEYIKENLKGLLTMLLAYELEDLTVDRESELNQRFDDELSNALSHPMIKKQLTDRANDFLGKEMLKSMKINLMQIIGGEYEAGQSKITEESDGTYKYQTPVYFDQETQILADEEGPHTYLIGDVTITYQYNN